MEVVAYRGYPSSLKLPNLLRFFFFGFFRAHSRVLDFFAPLTVDLSPAIVCFIDSRLKYSWIGIFLRIRSCLLKVRTLTDAGTLCLVSSRRAPDPPLPPGRPATSWDPPVKSREARRPFGNRRRALDKECRDLPRDRNRSGLVRYGSVKF